MLASLKPLALRAARSVPVQIRALATHATPLPSVPASSQLGQVSALLAEKNENGPLRQQLNIQINPNHGLYGFFRRKEDKGAVSYETLETADVTKDQSGRSWNAAELRRKSFKDLHTLWYVLLRERNLLATQIEEARRLGVHPNFLSVHGRMSKCRKSMARIKYVINERRLAYERAMKAYEEQRDADMAEEQAQIEAGKQELAAQQQAEAKAREAQLRKDAGEAQTAARLAGAGLFETVQQGEGQAKS